MSATYHPWKTIKAAALGRHRAPKVRSVGGGTGLE